jgi:uncharacterized protein YecE (DUF72 family)
MVPEPAAASVSAEGGPSTKPGPLWVGTAGFSYPDWIGPVWGGVPAARPGRGAREHPLERLSTWVDLLEVNVSHYRIPAPGTAQAWLRHTAARPGFRFTAKVWRGFTHGPERPSVADLAAMRAFLAALASDGRLLAALAQFPPSFRRGERELAYVLRLADHFEGVALACEFRHPGWDREDVLAALRARGIAWVAPDFPAGPRAAPVGAHVTSDLAYVRFHGRSAAWNEPGAGRDRKYDHLYSPEELAPWTSRIEDMRRSAARTVVVFNNHYSGKALVNALEWKAADTGERVEVPASLVEAYPRLARIAR